MSGADQAGTGMTDTRSVALIVDDEPLGRKVLEAALHELDCRLLTAANGADALVLAETETPDVVLLDVLMPGMDGIEVCQRIRANERLREVPVLLVTALDDRETRLQGLSAGADDFLTKPIDREEVRSRVRTILRLNRFRKLREEVDRSRRAADEAREYARRLVHAEEEERKRVARELHDQVGQQLAAVKLSLGLLTATLPATLRRDAAGVSALVDEAIEQVREVSRSLRPALLDDAGLVPALTALARMLRRSTALEVEVRAPQECPRFDPAVEASGYRIAQEAITNAMRHSGARRIEIVVDITGGLLTVAIRDAGRGFDVATALRNAGEGRSLGLLSMQERARLSGGQVELESTPGIGTAVTVRFPIQGPSRTA